MEELWKGAPASSQDAVLDNVADLAADSGIPQPTEAPQIIPPWMAPTIPGMPAFPVLPYIPELPNVNSLTPTYPAPTDAPPPSEEGYGPYPVYGPIPIPDYQPEIPADAVWTNPPADYPTEMPSGYGSDYQTPYEQQPIPLETVIKDDGGGQYLPTPIQTTPETPHMPGFISDPETPWTNTPEISTPVTQQPSVVSDPTDQLWKPNQTESLRSGPDEKIYYHGKASEFQTFEEDKFNSNGLYGPGLYLTDQPVVAASGNYDRPGYGETRALEAGQGPITDYFRERLMILEKKLREFEESQKNIPEENREEYTNIGNLNYLRNKLKTIDTTDQVGPNIRPIIVPNSLNLLDVSDQATPEFINSLAKIGGWPVKQFRVQAIDIIKMPGDPPAQIDDIYNVLSDVAGGVAYANKILIEAGYDGIKYPGGRIMPLRDDQGNEIKHEAVVIFPESLPKIRNAITGQARGATPFSLSDLRPSLAPKSDNPRTPNNQAPPIPPMLPPGLPTGGDNQSEDLDTKWKKSQTFWENAAGLGKQALKDISRPQQALFGGIHAGLTGKNIYDQAQAGWWLEQEVLQGEDLMTDLENLSGLKFPHAVKVSSGFLFDVFLDPVGMGIPKSLRVTGQVARKNNGPELLQRLGQSQKDAIFIRMNGLISDLATNNMSSVDSFQQFKGRGALTKYLVEKAGIESPWAQLGVKGEDFRAIEGTIASATKQGVIIPDEDLIKFANGDYTPESSFLIPEHQRTVLKELKPYLEDQSTGRAKALTSFVESTAKFIDKLPDKAYATIISNKIIANDFRGAVDRIRISGPTDKKTQALVKTLTKHLDTYGDTISGEILSPSIQNYLRDYATNILKLDMNTLDGGPNFERALKYVHEMYKDGMLGLNPAYELVNLISGLTTTAINLGLVKLADVKPYMLSEATRLAERRGIRLTERQIAQHQGLFGNTNALTGRSDVYGQSRIPVIGKGIQKIKNSNIPFVGQGVLERALNRHHFLTTREQILTDLNKDYVKLVHTRIDSSGLPDPIRQRLHTFLNDYISSDIRTPKDIRDQRVNFLSDIGGGTGNSLTPPPSDPSPYDHLTKPIRREINAKIKALDPKDPTTEAKAAELMAEGKRRESEAIGKQRALVKANAEKAVLKLAQDAKLKEAHREVYNAILSEVSESPTLTANALSSFVQALKISDGMAAQGMNHFDELVKQFGTNSPEVRQHMDELTNNRAEVLKGFSSEVSELRAGLSGVTPTSPENQRLIKRIIEDLKDIVDITIDRYDVVKSGISGLSPSKYREALNNSVYDPRNQKIYKAIETRARQLQRLGESQGDASQIQRLEEELELAQRDIGRMQDTIANTLAPTPLAAPPPPTPFTPSTPAPKLPPNLAGAKTNFKYPATSKNAAKDFSLTFDSDLDKAFLIIAQDKKSARDAAYLEFIMTHTGLDEASAREAGKKVKAQIREIVIKSPNEEAGENLRIPNLYQQQADNLARATAPSLPPNSVPSPQTVQAIGQDLIAQAHGIDDARVSSTINQADIRAREELTLLEVQEKEMNKLYDTWGMQADQYFDSVPPSGLKGPYKEQLYPFSPEDYKLLQDSGVDLTTELDIEKRLANLEGRPTQPEGLITNSTGQVFVNSPKEGAALNKLFNQISNDLVNFQEGANAQATQAMIQAKFNYANGKTKIDEYLSFISPFTVFQLRNIPYWAETFIRHPELFTATAKYVSTTEQYRNDNNLPSSYFAKSPLWLRGPDQEPTYVSPMIAFSIIEQAYQAIRSAERLRYLSNAKDVDPEKLALAQADLAQNLVGGLGMYQYMNVILKAVAGEDVLASDALPPVYGYKVLQGLGIDPMNFFKHWINDTQRSLQGRANLIGSDYYFDSAFRTALRDRVIKGEITMDQMLQTLQTRTGRIWEETYTRVQGDQNLQNIIRAFVSPGRVYKTPTPEEMFMIKAGKGADAMKATEDFGVQPYPSTSSDFWKGSEGQALLAGSKSRLDDNVRINLERLVNQFFATPNGDKNKFKREHPELNDFLNAQEAAEKRGEKLTIKDYVATLRSGRQASVDSINPGSQGTIPPVGDPTEITKSQQRNKVITDLEAANTKYYSFITPDTQKFVDMYYKLSADQKKVLTTDPAYVKWRNQQREQQAWLADPKNPQAKLYAQYDYYLDGTLGNLTGDERTQAKEKLKKETGTNTYERFADTYITNAGRIPGDIASQTTLQPPSGLVAPQVQAQQQLAISQMFDRMNEASNPQLRTFTDAFYKANPKATGAQYFNALRSAGLEPAYNTQKSKRDALEANDPLVALWNQFSDEQRSLLEANGINQEDLNSMRNANATEAFSQWLTAKGYGGLLIPGNQVTTKGSQATPNKIPAVVVVGNNNNNNSGINSNSGNNSGNRTGDGQSAESQTINRLVANLTPDQKKVFDTYMSLNTAQRTTWRQQNAQLYNTIIRPIFDVAYGAQTPTTQPRAAAPSRPSSPAPRPSTPSRPSPQPARPSTPTQPIQPNQPFTPTNPAISQTREANNARVIRSTLSPSIRKELQSNTISPQTRTILQRLWKQSGSKLPFESWLQLLLQKPAA